MPCRANRHVSAELSQAHAHARQADPRTHLGTLASAPRHTVVRDHDVQLLVVCPAAHHDLRSFGVTMHIRQRLLHDAQDGFLGRRDQPVHGAVAVEPNGQVRAPREAITIVAQGQRQAVALKNRRVQKVCGYAQLLHRLRNRQLDVVQDLLNGCVGFHPRLEPHQVEVDSDQMLDRRVVQLLGDQLALVLPRRQEPAAQIPCHQLSLVGVRDILTDKQQTHLIAAHEPRAADAEPLQNSIARRLNSRGHAVDLTG